MRRQGAKLVRQVGHFGLLSCPEWGGPASVSRLMLIDAAQWTRGSASPRSTSATEDGEGLLGEKIN